MLTKQLKDAWLAELRDPNNTQCKTMYFPGGVMVHQKASHKDATCMCALGALIKVQANLLPNYDNDVDLFPCMHDSHLSQQIMILNDNDDKTLPQIADWVEVNVPAE